MANPFPTIDPTPLAKPVEAASFTPGPWATEDNREYELSIGETPSNWIGIKATDGFTIASAYCRDYEINRANGRLIAAAPDLLEFAEWTVRLLTSAKELGLHLDMDKKHLLATAEAAIKKARG